MDHDQNAQETYQKMTYLLFACGLTLSAVAAYYSVMGLIAIFSTAVIPIAIMGTVLEASKLVSASWLYRNWSTIPKLLKLYFTTAVIVLMLLTSMGIFGYLSKAHLDQAVPSGDVAAKLSIVDEKIKTAKENIDANRKALKQMDEAVDQIMARSQDEAGATKASALRKQQSRERTALFSSIEAEQKTIATLNEQRAPIAAEVRKVDAEVGPIKYIAALIYGDNIDDTLLEKSVRIVILLIVFVFDPLAVLLLIAANREMVEQEKVEEVYTYANTEPPTEDELEELDELLEDPEPEYEEPCPKCGTIMFDAPGIGIYCPNKECDVVDGPDLYLEDRWENIISGLENPPEAEPEVAIELADVIPEPVFEEPVVEEPKSEWIIPEPPAEVGEDFKKVVKEYFKKDEHVKESMLYVNEDPEPQFQLSTEVPDFNPKDPFEEGPRPPSGVNSHH